LVRESDLAKIVGVIPDSGINHILFRCDREENDITGGQKGPYGLFSG